MIPSQTSPTPIPAFAPDLWLFQVFSPLAVASGLPLRRPLAEVEARLGRARFTQEAALRGYGVTEEGGDLVLRLDRKALRVMI